MRDFLKIIFTGWVTTTFLSAVLFLAIFVFFRPYTLVSSDTLGVLGIIFGVGGQIIYRKLKDPPVIKPILPYWLFNIVRFGFTGLFVVLGLNYSIRFGKTTESYEYTMLVNQDSRVQGYTSVTRCFLELDQGNYFKYRDALAVECEQVPTDEGVVTYVFSTGIFGMKVVEGYRFSNQRGKPLRVIDVYQY